MIDATAPHVPGSATSQAAAEAIRPHSCRLRMAVLETLYRCGGLTDEEGQRNTGISANTWRPRRRECQMLGWIRDGGSTRLTESRRRAVVWVVTERGKGVLAEVPHG